MATITNQPATYSTAYNPNVFNFESVNMAFQGFRFVFELYLNGATTASYREIFPPNSQNNQLDISNFLGANLNVNLSTFQGLSGNYRVKIGEEFSLQWSYQDTTFDGTTEVIGLTPHGYVVGDVVNVVPTNPNLFPAFSGVMVVKAVNNVYSMTFDVPFQSTATNPGKIAYADGRKTRTMGEFSSIFYFYKSAIPSYEWSKTTLQYNYVGKKFLTTFNSGFKISKMLSNMRSLVFGFISMDPMIVCNALDSNGVGYIIPFVSIGNNVYLVLASADVLPLDSINYYDIWINDDKGSVLTSKMRINVDKNCGPNNTQVSFIDRMGSLQSLFFKGFAQKKVSVNREEFNKPLTFDEGNYSTSDAGYTTSDTELNDVYTLHSMSYSREQDLIFQELMSAKTVLLTENGTDFKAIQIQNTAMDLKDLKQMGVRTRSIDFKYSIKDLLND